MMPKDAVVLITGASSGIGAELARVLAKQGRRLILTARRADRLETLAIECRVLGAQATVIAADLADISGLHALIDQSLKVHNRLDVLVNNAGYGLGGMFAESNPADLAKQIDVNFVAPVTLARLALPHLQETKGIIINVGSSMSVAAIPAFGVYGATKAALGYWNDALRRELKSLGIRVCLVEPGPIRTEFLDVIAAQSKRPPTLWESRPPNFVNGRADDAARRIARLLDHPRRRISMLRRIVWPLRVAGALSRLAPWLGDAVLCTRTPAEGTAR